MSEITKINTTLEAPNGQKAALMAPLTDNPVIASAMVTCVPATFGSGNIGHLAITTVANRLLAAGADPRYVSATVTIDEDTQRGIMKAVTLGMRDAVINAEMEWAQVISVAKQTGPATGIAVSAFGVGQRMAAASAGFRQPRESDHIIITGPAGATGAAIKAAEKGMSFSAQSDGTVLIDVMRAAYSHSLDIAEAFYPIDGIESALEAVGVEADIDPAKVPVTDEVINVCSALNLNPLNLSTADAMLLFVSPKDTDKLLEAIRRYPAGQQAAIIGKVTSSVS